MIAITPWLKNGFIIRRIIDWQQQAMDMEVPKNNNKCMGPKTSRPRRRHGFWAWVLLLENPEEINIFVMSL